MTNEVAERYAQGLFELARETGTVREKKEQAGLILRAIDENPELEVFLRAVKITKDEKKNLIAGVFADAADTDTINLIKLLIDKGRIYYFREIFSEFVRLADDELGVATALVESARELKAEDLERIRKALEKKTGRTISLRTKINPDLIAGIKVTVGSNVTDVTMKTKIEAMKEALLKGGQA
ncbi:MAG: ATP synthase F1 subunit delta [Erysipelotrichaceae bacterium]|jgi:F-type H+-transporting ATPase subunit delta|nr:ATP synthase F1 subunit delta [Erysipelotrichaceae bacterium]MDO5109947.1 ATP synthase F1 subunit delta [Erysipelotrichaceae bacterium]